MISDPQIGASRGFLGWTARDLGNKAAVATATVQKTQSGELAASLAALVAIQATLATRGSSLQTAMECPASDCIRRNRLRKQ